MATDIFARVVPGGLMCVNQAEASKLEHLVGKEVKARISMPRNWAFLKKYFALLKVGRDMADTDMNPEQWRAYCQAGAGWCTFENINGTMVAIPKSISFSNMDEIEFERLYNAVLGFICETWAIDEDQVNQIVGFM